MANEVFTFYISDIQKLLDFGKIPYRKCGTVVAVFAGEKEPEEVLA